MGFTTNFYIWNPKIPSKSIPRSTGDQGQDFVVLYHNILPI